MDRCLLCESKQIKLKFRKNDFSYCRCQLCQSLLVDLTLTPDVVFSYYSESYYEENACVNTERRGGYPSYKESERSLTEGFQDKLRLVRSFKSSGRLLDAGAAYGLFLKTASPYFDGVGIDVSEYAASVARNNYGVDVQTGDIEHTNFPDEHFDVVVLWDIIEHLIRPVEAIKEINRILKPGGYMFISTDDAANWLPRSMGRYWWALGPPMHLCHFSKKGMKIAIERAGFNFESFQKDPRRYSVAEIVKHLGTSYQSGITTWLGKCIEKTGLGRTVFHITRPEQFVAIARKPLVGRA